MSLKGRNLLKWEEYAAMIQCLTIIIIFSLVLQICSLAVFLSCKPRARLVIEMHNLSSKKKSVCNTDFMYTAHLMTDLTYINLIVGVRLPQQRTLTKK